MSVLSRIATAMRYVAETIKAPAQHRLSRGLVLTLRVTEAETTLSLTRKGTPPSQTEEAINRRAFDVPPGAERTTDRVGEYHIIRYTWATPQPEQARLWRRVPAQAGRQPTPPATETYYRE